MSDIPPDLLEEAKRVCAEYRRLEAIDRLLLRLFYWAGWWLGAALLVLAFSTCSHAAALDMTDVYCERFEPGLDGKFYIAEDPPYTPDCSLPWVTLRVAKFKTLVDAYEGGAAPSTPSQFTADEVAMLKWQAANPSPFNLSLVDGGLVGGSVLAVWALAAIFKTIGRQVSGHFSPSED